MELLFGEIEEVANLLVSLLSAGSSSQNNKVTTSDAASSDYEVGLMATD